MRAEIRGVHLSLTEDIKEFVEKHLIAPFEHFYQDEAAEMVVTLRDSNGPKGGLDKECRVTVHLPHINTIQITEASEDIYKSVCFARDRLERVAKRQLEKHRPDTRSHG
ncbi:MAG TPA: HPF/RaiA family ribosome-associated protein [Myxococcaceae bacterium]|nr:HPF/RaiA family ribosome-associated protein [Myxococcaceae bacterium]